MPDDFSFPPILPGKLQNLAGGAAGPEGDSAWQPASKAVAASSASSKPKASAAVCKSEPAPSTAASSSSGDSVASSSAEKASKLDSRVDFGARVKQERPEPEASAPPPAKRNRLAESMRKRRQDGQQS